MGILATANSVGSQEKDERDKHATNLHCFLDGSRLMEKWI